MSLSFISGVGSVDLGVTDLQKSKAFYTGIWLLDLVCETKDSVYLRGAGTNHHILALHQNPVAEALRVNLTARSRESVDRVREAAQKRGCSFVSKPAELNEPGGGYAVTFKDMEGRVFRVIHGVEQLAEKLSDPDQPEALTHVAINSPQREELAQFYCDVLNMRVIDRTKVMTFVCAGPDHHCLAIAGYPNDTLNHLAFETRDVDAVMRGGGRLKEKGIPIEWGVGRHGPGNNIFAYFLGPDEEIIEYTADVSKVDQTYRVGTPEDWVWPDGRNDHWGLNSGPSARYKASQSKIRFAEKIFQLPT